MGSTFASESMPGAGEPGARSYLDLSVASISHANSNGSATGLGAKGLLAIGPDAGGRGRRLAGQMERNMKWLALAVGGGIGATLRYALSVWVDQRLLAGFPWGTFAVNVIGSLLVGFLITWLDHRHPGSATLRLFLITGLLGAFTTFSTFSVETLQLIEAGRLAQATFNAAGSVLACVLAVMAGVGIARSLG